jgi:beta-galactosidase
VSSINIITGDMKQCILYSIFLLLLLTQTVAAQQTPDTVYEPDFFPFSVWYSGGDARAPMLSEVTEDSREEWLEDLNMIKSLGFNTVRTWVEWQKAEPREGEYNFENLELLLELADEAGLKVFIQMYADSAPEWVGKQNPDAKFQTQSGVMIESQSAPGYCPDHSDVREAIMNFYTQTAKVATRYDNFYGWDLWSEPHIINWANIDYVQNAQFCYCPYTQQRFREWLKTKYQTLEQLNTAWHREFIEWEDVSPPRFSTILSYTDYLDWKTFIYEKLAEDLRMRYDAVRAGDPHNVITSHAAVSSIIISPHMGVGATDDFLMSDSVDYYGVSLYPKHNHPDRHWPAWRVMNFMDFTRSANRENKGWYVGELQAGKGTIALLVGDPVTPGDHNVWAWSAISKGAQAINIYSLYPMSSGYESGGYGLINQDGSLTPRAGNAGKIAKTVTKHMDLILDSEPVQAEVALVYNPLSQMVGGAQRRYEYPSGHHDSLIGYYRVLAENNIPVDFIHRRDLENEDLSQYKLVLLPWLMMLTQEAADGIKNYVENGGFAVAEARTGWNDERGYSSDVIPGMGLSEVFGVREKEVWMREELLPMPLTNNSSILADDIGASLSGFLYGTTFDLLNEDDTNIIASFDQTGDPVVVHHTYGRGQTVAIGSFLGLANHPNQTEENNRFILGLTELAGVEKPVFTSVDGQLEEPVALQLQKNSVGTLLYAINHGTSEQTFTISVPVESDQEYELFNLIDETTESISATNGHIEITTRLNGRDASVWSITKN